MQEVIEQNIRLQKANKKRKKKMDKEWRDKEKQVADMKDKLRKIEDEIQWLRGREVGLRKGTIKSTETEKEIY